MTIAADVPATGTAPTGPRLVAGIDLLALRERDADQQVLDLAAALTARGATDLSAATHWAQVGALRHVALSVKFSGIGPGAAWTLLAGLAERRGDAWGLLLGERYSGQPELRGGLEATVAAHRDHGSGRLVVFAGSAVLVGTIAVAEVIANSAIDRVRVLAGGDAPGDALLVTRDFVRPRRDHGPLILDVQPAAGGTLVPFETPAPTPCCAEHS